MNVLNLCQCVGVSMSFMLGVVFSRLIVATVYAMLLFASVFVVFVVNRSSRRRRCFCLFLSVYRRSRKLAASPCTSAVRNIENTLSRS